MPLGGQTVDVSLVCLADAIVGLSFGATSVAGGLAWWVPVALSVLVFAGGSQIAAVGVVLAGGSPVAAVLAGAVLNTRLFPYGLAVADVLSGPDRAVGPGTGGSPGDGRDPGDGRSPDIGGDPGDNGPNDGRGASVRGASVRGASVRGAGGPTGPRMNALAERWLRGLRRLVGTHLVTDESVAFAIRQPSPERRRAAFWTCGVMLFVVWNLAVLLGVALGSAIRDTNAFGLDATFPAVMLALALPTLTSRSTRIAAGTGAVIAVALTPVLPAGLPLLAALGGLSARWDWRNRSPRQGRRGRRWAPRSGGAGSTWPAGGPNADARAPGNGRANADVRAPGDGRANADVPARDDGGAVAGVRAHEDGRAAADVRARDDGGPVADQEDLQAGGKR